MFENECLNFDNLFNDDIDNSDFDDIEEATEGVYKKLPKLIAITPENIEPCLTTEKNVKNYSKDYLFQLTHRQLKLQKMLEKVDKNSQDYKDIIAEMKSNKESAKKILKAREKFGLPDIRNDSSFSSIAGYGLLGNELINGYISKNKSSLEACDEYDDYDEAEEASSKALAHKTVKEYKKAAKNNYLISQHNSAMAKHPILDDDTRYAARINEINYSQLANTQARYVNKERKSIKDGAYDHKDGREKDLRDDNKLRYKANKDLNRSLGIKRRNAKKNLEYLDKLNSPKDNNGQAIKGRKAKEDALGLFDDDFEFEQDVLALEDALSMLVDEDEREDEFDRAVDEIEEINHPVDEILDEATESTGLFDTSTPAISNGLFEDLFKPATEAVEDDDEAGDLLEEDDGDDDFSDDELDGYVEPKQDYSDKEYDRDEALEEDF